VVAEERERVKKTVFIDRLRRHRRRRRRRLPVDPRWLLEETNCH